MPETTRLSDGNDWIDLDFVERERTPESAMKIDIQMHIDGPSLLNPISVLDKLGVQRQRKAVHDWIQKADLPPAGGTSPNHVVLDESMIRSNAQKYWLYAAVNFDTNRFLHLFPTYTTGLTDIFLHGLCDKHDVNDDTSLIDGDQWLQACAYWRNAAN